MEKHNVTNNLPVTLDSQEATITTGQVLRATGIVVLSCVITAALCVGAFRLGFETSRANIYERQNADLRVLIGIVDQAKGREFASCTASGRSDCMSIIAPVVP